MAIEVGRARLLRISDRGFACLVWLLPGGLRREYAEPMRQTFADLCAASLHQRGATGLVATWVRALPDLLATAGQEWAAAILPAGPARPARVGGVGATLLTALVLIYSQVRYPANLSRPGYLVPYLILLAALGGLAVAIGRGRMTCSAAVPFGLATAPSWLTIYSDWPVLGIAGVAMVPVLLATAAAMAAPGVGASVRAGATAGAVAGAMLLLVNLGEGLATMAWQVHEPSYLAEYARTGQSDLAAYIVGERIAGGAYPWPTVFVAGALAGLLAGAARRLATRPAPSR
ncbi:MAG: hypothetical protein J2P15_20690 [Micromonosporaceae bacterium]|nr:hypothetical protein [Micromonosporaceae bacterium]